MTRLYTTWFLTNNTMGTSTDWILKLDPHDKADHPLANSLVTGRCRMPQESSQFIGKI
jgi:hypothetical protein